MQNCGQEIDRSFAALSAFCLFTYSARLQHITRRYSGNAFFRNTLIFFKEAPVSVRSFNLLTTRLRASVDYSFQKSS